MKPVPAEETSRAMTTLLVRRNGISAKEKLVRMGAANQTYRALALPAIVREIVSIWESSFA